VLAIEPRAAARDLARSWGADTVVHPDEVSERMHLAQPIVIEATGAAAGLQLPRHARRQPAQSQREEDPHWIDRVQRSAALGVIPPGQLVNAQVELDEPPDALIGKAKPDTIKTALRLDPADA
jgi:hypothetical protein